MQHYFDIEIAQIYGVNAAIILQNLGHWIKRNEANDVNFFDGYYWTFNSRRAYRELFPYMSERQIDTAFRKLIDDGLVITGNYNAQKYDRTLWYALTQKGKCILHFDGMENLKMSNGLDQNVKPIPNINTDNKPDINTDKRKAANRFTPPTVEEVQAYCRERQNNVDPQRFIDYYEARGWLIGKNKMKDWKAAVRTWERSGYNNSPSRSAPQQQNQMSTAAENYLKLIEEANK
ncbi:MAG: hypothetical protein J6J71_01395 [Prevotella sp.]|nr:hypothetical protein [Prevotella sp.]